MKSGDTIYERFHKLEKQCIEYENYINNEDKNYLETLDGLKKLITEI